MSTRSCPSLTQFDPLFEIVDELPEVDMDQSGRYIYVTTDETFYVLSHGGWLPLGVDFPVKPKHIQLKLTDDSFAVKAENIPCWTDDYMSNVQLSFYDFEIDIRSAKKGEYLSNNAIENFHIDVYGFNKVSSNSLLITDSIGTDIPIDTSVTTTLNHISNKSDVNLFLTEDTTSGKYLGDPCFTVYDSLILDSKFLSILSGEDISCYFFDSTSNIQFVVDNLGYKWNNSGFTTMTGAPRTFSNIQSGKGISSTEPTDFLRIGSDSDNYEFIEFNSIYGVMETYIPDDVGYDISCGEFEWQVVDNEIRANSLSHCPAHLVTIDKYDHYVLDVMIGASDDSGESIYVVIAHVDIDGEAHTLSAVRHMGAAPDRFYSRMDQVHMFSIVYDLGLDTQRVILETDVVDPLPADLGWKGRYSRIQIRRQGASVTAITSNIDDYGLNYGSSLTINVNDFQILHKFKDSQSIGFGTLLQFNAWFKDPAAFLRDAAGTEPSPFLRGNGVDWTAFNMVTADEIYAPLTGCFDDCECSGPDANTVSLQQTLCQLFKNVFDCKDYIQFEHFVNTDEEISLMMPMGLEDPDDPESPIVPIDPVPRIIYDIRTDDVWVFACGEWVIDDCRSVCKLEKNRMYFNTVTRKLFYLACDCSVYCLMNFTLPDNYCA